MSRSSLPSRLALLYALSGLLPGPALPAEAQGEKVLKAVKVKATRERRSDVARSAPVTTIGRARMERFQAATVFEAAEGIPGVSLEGGPRASGTQFVIRGYNDSEDTLIKVDGAQKNFEKYRYGGTFIEPDMLKSLSVTRGPDLLQGAGAIGGTVEAVSVDAADLLRPGRRVGARGKFGTASVNDEIHRHGAVYARPDDAVDLLFSATSRQSNDYRLPDGSRLENSGGEQRSTLFKTSVFPSDGLSMALSASTNQVSSLEAFDATGGQPGLFGFVTRDVDDSTNALRARWEPGGNPWIDLTAVLGHSNTTVHDLSRPGQSFIANTFTGNVNDRYDYDVGTLDLRNVSRLRTGPLGHEVTLSVQGVDNRRTVSRVTENALLNAILYPGGFNPAQPSGARRSLGVVGIYALSVGPFTVAPGVRWDDYEVSVEGRTKDLLVQAGQAPVIRYDETTSSLALTWRMSADWIAGWRYVEGFRPPLIDEAFTRGAFSRCTPFFLGSLAPATGVCGDLYVPERSTTRELSLTWSPAQPVRGVRGFFRAAVFRSDRRNVLTSIQVVSPGVIGQPGSEDRHGVEVEANLDARHVFANVAWTRIDGEARDGRGGVSSLYTVPGDTLSLTLGGRALEGRVDAGVRYRHVGPRAFPVGVAPVGGLPPLGTQPGFELVDLFVGMRPSPGFELRFGVENATNESYFLTGFGGGQGAQAPGRGYRVTGTLQF